MRNDARRFQSVLTGFNRCRILFFALWIIQVFAVINCSSLKTKIANIPKSHPESDIQEKSGSLIDSKVAWIWSGALTPASVWIKAMVAETGSPLRLLVSTNRDLSSPFIFDFKSIKLWTNHHILDFHATDLEPGTQYFYALEMEGHV